MKKLIYCFLSYVILFTGCAKNTVNSPEDNSKPLGKVSINIDKVNAPANVAFVMATLTKANADTLTGFMNLSNDTTAVLTFQNIAVGTWNLTVAAEDINGTVLYQGQSSVTVNQGVTTNVSLTLNPVLSGTGSISITIKWGTSLPYFTDYSYSPIYTGSDNPAGLKYITGAQILYDNSKYKMWYFGVYNSGAGNTWYAESSDGISWTNKYTTPVLNTGVSGSWDDLFASPGSVIKDNGVYKMYYNGGQASYGNYYIGLATSTDGINWQKYPAPVFAHDNSSQYYIGVHSVIKINSTYFMYYDAAPVNNYGQFNINLAVSEDGINWTKYSNNPILTPSLSWEGVGVSHPSVIYDGNQYTMIYQNSALETAFGTAYSPDGIHWTKKYRNPVFSISQTKLTTTQISYPYLMKINNEYRLYYSPSTYAGLVGISLTRTSSIQ
jgi:predicted GH43/DUF377 family glycosyl hydrolase